MYVSLSPPARATSDKIVQLVTSSSTSTFTTLTGTTGFLWLIALPITHNPACTLCSSCIYMLSVDWGLCSVRVWVARADMIVVWWWCMCVLYISRLLACTIHCLSYPVYHIAVERFHGLCRGAAVLAPLCHCTVLCSTTTEPLLWSRVDHHVHIRCSISYWNKHICKKCLC